MVPLWPGAVLLLFWHVDALFCSDGVAAAKNNLDCLTFRMQTHRDCYLGVALWETRWCFGSENRVRENRKLAHGFQTLFLLVIKVSLKGTYIYISYFIFGTEVQPQRYCEDARNINLRIGKIYLPSLKCHTLVREKKGEETDIKQ